MEFKVYSFRHAETILEKEFKSQYVQIIGILEGIKESEIIKTFQEKGANNKSLSTTINKLLKDRFIESEWEPESKIFKDKDFSKKSAWSLDFAKDDISIEVAFNHGTVAAWNLIKPTISGELNHIEKEVNTKIGVVITATNELKKAGGFDGAIGTYEHYLKYIRALNNILTIPILLIGIEAPNTFKIMHKKNAKGKKIGEVIYL